MLSKIDDFNLREALEHELEINQRVREIARNYVNKNRAEKKNRLLSNYERNFKGLKKEILRHKSHSVSLLLSTKKYVNELNKLKERIDEKIKLLKLEISILKAVLNKFDNDEFNSIREHNKTIILTRELLNTTILKIDSYEDAKSRIESFIRIIINNIKNPLIGMLNVIDEQRRFLNDDNKSLLKDTLNEEVRTNSKLIIGVSKISSMRRQGLNLRREVRKKTLIFDKDFLNVIKLFERSEKYEIISKIIIDSFKRIINEREENREKMVKGIVRELNNKKASKTII